MRIATVTRGHSTAAIVIDEYDQYIFADEIFPKHEYLDCLNLIKDYSPQEIKESFNTRTASTRELSSVEFRAPYTSPEMIWGIGLNYMDHAADLAAVAPGDEPASFIKGSHTIIGPDENIVIPSQSRRTTAEAELGLVIGKNCRNVEESEALSYVFGVVPVLDQTAEDILQKNPRFLTRSKNFHTFYSFGPWIMTLDEVFQKFTSLDEITVTTMKNGSAHRKNQISNMTFSPTTLLSFHSKVFTLVPGDMISTGTPGAVPIQAGDIAQCVIDEIGTLRNPVVDQLDQN
jgi:2-keto-4-pentenoate hydratase/2-oxohepta-3-ene-1,7-dioic acid hydratase in catechol pathway